MASGPARKGTRTLHGLIMSGRDRFVSVRMKSLFRFGSVRTIICPDSTRFGLRFWDASWLGPFPEGNLP